MATYTDDFEDLAPVGEAYLTCRSCGCSLGVPASDPYADPDCRCCENASIYGDIAADWRETGQEPPPPPVCPTTRDKTRVSAEHRIVDAVSDALRAGVDQRDIALALATAIDTARWFQQVQEQANA